MEAEHLSCQQRRVRQLAEHDGDGAPYRVSAVVDVRGSFDRARLDRMLQRTAADLPGVPSGLESAIRIASSTRAQWSLSAPALVADERTLQLVVERTVDAYRGVVTAEARSSPPLAYAACVRWQQGLMRDPDAASARAYWSDRSCPDASRFRLPVARESQLPRDFAPARLTRPLAEPLTREVVQLAAAARVDLATWLLAAFECLVWRHLETSSIQIGVGLDGRARAPLRDVLGPCARYVPVELDLEPRSTVADLARRTAQIVGEHRVWQDCFSWDALDRTGLDPAAVAYHAFGFDWHPRRGNLVGGRAAGSNPAFRITSLTGTLDRFDLRLIATRVGRRVDCELEWNRHLYDESDIARLADRYVDLVTDAAHRPTSRLADLEIVGRIEQDELVDRAQGPKDAAPDRLTHQAFEDHVAAEGNRIAVISGAARLTYADLDRRATALAARLQAAGVRHGDRVAICLPRSIGQLVAVFGVLKLGAAFLPLDPAVPWERLAWTVADANVPVLLAPAEAAARVPPDARVTLLVPDDVASGEVASAFVPPRVDPAATAYVIYTSGSTGRPKGVVVAHRQLVHSTEARRTHYGHGVGTFLLVSPLPFDSAMAGIFWTMSTGGTLVVPSEEEHNDPAALRWLIEAHGVTHVLCLPSLYGWLLEAGGPALASLQVVIVAGERCPAALTSRHRQALPGVELHNEYGPTECSVWSTVYKVGTVDDTAAVPIGRPIARAAVYVAERPWRLAPREVAAEALVGGAGIADGYLNRPDLTAERFVPDGWSGRPGARVYRTGDRVRRLASGELDFLGRVDHQVKIRGYRIELEEIEASIGAHPDVREAVVAVRAAAAGERLVAYVVPHVRTGETAVTLPDRLRRFLGERLPVYMLPGTIVTVDALPKTPHGKVDRARLPAPPSAGADGPSAPPTTGTERAIAALWQEALGRDQMGIHDNFFDLGGHSLMAIAVFARLRAARAPQLRLVDLFEHPTVHALAEFIDRQPSPDLEPAAVSAVPEEPAAVVADAHARQRALRRKRFEARAS